jgi:hypothetical protein
LYFPDVSLEDEFGKMTKQNARADLCRWRARFDVIAEVLESLQLARRSWVSDRHRRKMWSVLTKTQLSRTQIIKAPETRQKD